MLTLTILSFAILGLLCYGCYTDLKTRTVSNKITGAVLALSIILIFFNLPHLTIIHILAIALLFVAYAFDGLGGADVKVLTSLTLTQNIIHFLILYGVSLIIGGLLLFKYKEKAPFFLAITAGYAISILI